MKKIIINTILISTITIAASPSLIGMEPSLKRALDGGHIPAAKRRKTDLEEQVEIVAKALKLVAQTKGAAVCRAMQGNIRPECLPMMQSGPIIHDAILILLEHFKTVKHTHEAFIRSLNLLFILEELYSLPTLTKYADLTAENAIKSLVILRTLLKGEPEIDLSNLILAEKQNILDEALTLLLSVKGTHRYLQESKVVCVALMKNKAHENLNKAITLLSSVPENGFDWEQLVRAKDTPMLNEALKILLGSSTLWALAETHDDAAYALDKAIKFLLSLQQKFTLSQSRLPNVEPIELPFIHGENIDLEIQAPSIQEIETGAQISGETITLITIAEQPESPFSAAIEKPFQSSLAFDFDNSEALGHIEQNDISASCHKDWSLPNAPEEVSINNPAPEHFLPPYFVPIPPNHFPLPINPQNTSWLSNEQFSLSFAQSSNFPDPIFANNSLSNSSRTMQSIVDEVVRNRPLSAVAIAAPKKIINRTVEQAISAYFPSSPAKTYPHMILAPTGGIGSLSNVARGLIKFPISKNSETLYGAYTLYLVKLNSSENNLVCGKLLCNYDETGFWYQLVTPNKQNAARLEEAEHNYATLEQFFKKFYPEKYRLMDSHNQVFNIKNLFVGIQIPKTLSQSQQVESYPALFVSTAMLKKTAQIENFQENFFKALPKILDYPAVESIPRSPKNTPSNQSKLWTIPVHKGKNI